MSSPRTIGCHCCLAIIYFSLHLVVSSSLSSAIHDAADEELFTRYDRGAYLAARYVNVNEVGGMTNVDTEYLRSKDQIIRGGLDLDNGGGIRNNNNQPTYDDPNKCTTYLAPSSIPNSGLGMYTTTPYRRGEALSPLTEIGIIIQDLKRHYTSDKTKLLAQYPWASLSLTFGPHDVGYGESVIPGLGMLANSHLGLYNVRHSELWKTQPRLDGTDSYFRSDSLTMDDMGRGAHATHGRVMFEANAVIQGGEELFMSYGDDWFTSREHLIGVVPGEGHFKEADKWIKQFSEDDVQHGNDNHAQRSERYEKLLKNAFEKDKRLRAALPNNLQDFPIALVSGTARFSARQSIRSTEWLEENGACIDNIVSGVSTIPQAGKGAFATRSIHEGHTITTTPVITLERAELFLWEEHEAMKNGGVRMELKGHQLLRNYCYGHEDSSLLFFPYSPGVNFINHGSKEDANAEIRWSTVPYHEKEWLDETLEAIKDKMKTGLLFDIVAKREIRRGEEILLYYGKDWEKSWNQHVQDWPSFDREGINGVPPHLNLTERLGFPTPADLNQIDLYPIVRTKEEQAENSYPSYIMTRCRFEPPTDCVSPTTQNGHHCQSRWKLTFDASHVFPCTILSRDSIEGIEWYTAQVEVPSKGTTEITLHIVEYMTRDGILFVDKPYHKDQYSHGVFRHTIGLPDGLVPSHWMDVKEDVQTTEGGVQNEFWDDLDKAHDDEHDETSTS